MFETIDIDIDLRMVIVGIFIGIVLILMAKRMGLFFNLSRCFRDNNFYFFI